MRSSLLALIFIIVMTSLAIGYTSHLLVFRKGIEKAVEMEEQKLSNKNYITIIPFVLNKSENGDYNEIYHELRKLNNNVVTIELVELSSKINPNFVDFTIFETPPLSKTLKDGITWKDLNKFRIKEGLVHDIEVYNQFFKEGVDIITAYNLPNINNASDIALEMLYSLYTGDESRAYSFKDAVIQNRKRHQLLDERKLKSFLATYDDSIGNIVTTIPTWNINYVDEDVLRTILSKKYQGKKIENAVTKIRALLLMRENEYIDDEKLKYNLYPKKNEESILSYLGSRTTFWQVIVTDKKNNLVTNFIFKWNAESYVLISLTTKELE